MKRASLLICAAMALAMTGCNAITDMVKDAALEPEDIVVDYATTIAEIYSSEADCDKLALELGEYCERRQEKVTKAISETLLRIENDKIDAKKRNEIYDELSKIKDARNTSCLLSVSVMTEMAICSKPLLSAISKMK